MRYLFLFLMSAVVLSACDDTSGVEIYNENNTTVINGIVYNIDEKPINGIYKIYYPNGNVRMEVESKDGKPDGEGKFYNEDGILSYHGTFQAGVLNGAVINYYSNGSIHNELQYIDGQLSGEQKTYDENGNLSVEAVFDHGKAVSGYAMIDGQKIELNSDDLKHIE